MSGEAMLGRLNGTYGACGAERNWYMRIPGFSGDEMRPGRRQVRGEPLRSFLCRRARRQLRDDATDAPRGG
jgi:hypothetical protein